MTSKIIKSNLCVKSHWRDSFKALPAVRCALVQWREMLLLLINQYFSSSVTKSWGDGILPHFLRICRKRWRVQAGIRSCFYCSTSMYRFMAGTKAIQRIQHFPYWNIKWEKKKNATKLGINRRILPWFIWLWGTVILNLLGDILKNRNNYPDFPARTSS